MTRYLDELEERGLSLIIYRDEEVVFSSASRGIIPLLDAIDTLGRSELSGTLIIDKILGRAAALLIVYMDAAEAQAALISMGAKEVLRSNGVRFHYSEDTPTIKNIDGTDMCPFERLIIEVSNPEEAYRRIKAKAFIARSRSI